MKMPRFWFTVRRMMIATAIICLICGVGSSLKRRADAYSLRAVNYGLQRNELRACELIFMEKAEVEEFVKSERARATHLRAMQLKYERAARYPWLPVALDPD